MAYLIRIPISGDYYTGDHTLVNPSNVASIDPLEKDKTKGDSKGKIPKDAKSRIHMIGGRFYNSTLSPEEIERMFTEGDEGRP